MRILDAYKLSLKSIRDVFKKDKKKANVKKHDVKECEKGL